MANLIITIARAYGSNGRSIGKKLASELGINCYDRSILGEASETGESIDELFDAQSKEIRAIADRESCVIVGRCADDVLKGVDGVIRVHIYASQKYCIKTIMDMYGVSPSEAESLIKETDKNRASYYKHYTGKEWNNFANYDLCLNTSTLGIDGCVKLIKDYIEILKNR